MARKAKVLSESEALRDALSYITAVREAIEVQAGMKARGIFLEESRQVDWLNRAARRLMVLEEQAKAGLHANPSLVIFGNPGRSQGRSRDNLMSNDVLAVLYRHRDDGEFYVHGFGDASLKLKGSPREGVGIGGLKERTGVKMVANEDGSVTLYHDRHSIHGEF